MTFIDQLIDDKKILGERCEELLGKLKTVDKKFTDKIKLLEEKYVVIVSCRFVSTKWPIILL